MPRGSKVKYTNKQKRQAKHIEEGYEKRGVSAKEAVKRAWATVNKETGGGKKAGSGKGQTKTTSAAKKGGNIGGKKSSKVTAKQAAKKTAATSAAKKASVSNRRGPGRPKGSKNKSN